MSEIEAHPQSHHGRPLTSDGGLSSARRSSGATSSKLRDSCHACAVAKVKCPKEKPSCSRCETRGAPCQYFFTKRPGRRRESENNKSRTASTITCTSNGDGHSRENDGDTILARRSSLNTRLLNGSPAPTATMAWANSYMTMPISPRLDGVLDPELADGFPVLDENTMFPELGEFGSDVNDMDFVLSAMDSPFRLTMLDGHGSSSSGGMLTPSGIGKDIGSLLLPQESTGLDLGASSETSSAADFTSGSSSRGSSLAANMHRVSSRNAPLPQISGESSPCECLTRSLNLLKMLSLSQSTPFTTSLSGSPELGSGHSDAPVTDGPAGHAVLVENKQSIEAVNRMLACSSCSEDSFLLTLSSMIVLKTLERYAAAARPSSRAGAGAGGDMDMDRAMSFSDDQSLAARRAAQLVLGELHRVQRVVNELSPKLKKSGREGRQCPELDFGDGHRGRYVPVMGGVEAGEKGAGTAAFSADTLGRLESDVRKSLSSLSAKIINVLRHS